MARATVDRKVLDMLIRAKAATMETCTQVRPLPVRWRVPDEQGTNWTVSGWTGETAQVTKCMEEMGAYIRLLHANFRIPAPAGGAESA